MTLSKTTPSNIKINTLPVVKKAAFSPLRSMSACSLPPSLLKLPTMSSSSQSRHNLPLDLEFNETMLDEWLVRLDKVAKAAADERSIEDMTRKVSFATTISSPSSATTPLSPSTTARKRVSFESSEITKASSPRPVAKRRRFARRNSFVIRDLAQLSKLADQIVGQTQSQTQHDRFVETM